MPKKVNAAMIAMMAPAIIRSVGYLSLTGGAILNIMGYDEIGSVLLAVAGALGFHQEVSQKD